MVTQVLKVHGIMRDFPSCFSESGVQVADASSGTTRTAQNLVTCVYHCQLRGTSCFIHVTWTKNLMGQGLNVGIENSANQCLCKVDMKPWLFSKRKGYRSLEVDGNSSIDIYWDLSSAKFGSRPEPIEGFYLAIVFNEEVILLLGDMEKEAYKKIDANANATATPVVSSAVFVAKREHIFGKRLYGSKAQFSEKGRVHDIAIECDTAGTNDPSLTIRIDNKAVVQVSRLRWKFRGNHTITVDGVPIEVYWDVHSWLFGSVLGNAVFLFQTGLSVSTEKSWTMSSSAVLNWSDGQSFREFKSPGHGFSLMLYAWKNE